MPTSAWIVISVLAVAVVLGLYNSFLSRRDRIARQREFEALYRQADAKTRALVDQMGMPTFRDKTATKTPADLIRIARAEARRTERARKHHRGGR
jgi:hypothetical protein